MVTGAVAAIVYGEPRLTSDIDFLVASCGTLRNGGSRRRDIRAMLRALGQAIDRPNLLAHIRQLGLNTEWARIEAA